MKVRGFTSAAALAGLLIGGVPTPATASARALDVKLYSPRAESIVHGPTTIRFTAPGDEVAEVVLTSGDGTVLGRDTEAPWAIDFDFTGYRGDVWYQARDSDGNRSPRYRADYTVDDDGPTIALKNLFVAPGVHRISAEFADRSAMAKVEWWIAGALRGTGVGVDYDFGPVARVVPVEIRAWDNHGNQTVRTFDVQVDNTVPVVKKVTPDYKQLVRGTSVTSTVTVTDPAGFSRVNLSGAVVAGKVDGPTATFTGKFPVGKDGYYTLRWNVVDSVLNRTTFPRTFVVDNTRPKITKVTAPASGAKVGPVVTTSMTATDLNGIREVQVWVNGKLTNSDARAPYVMNVDTSKRGKSFTVAFYAVDKAGNAVSTSVRTWKR